ncbi:MAG: hypothetical protein OEZ24_01535 [Candidatus Bathyarchaeota archaeon]|nr:hypothetical protein [Candidatus Bathyarchaeota archaeon]
MERVMSGLAAYDAMSEALLRDEDFPSGKLDVLTSRCVPIANDGIPLLSEKRKSAIRFLTSMAKEEPALTDELEKAPSEYTREAQVLDQAASMVPYSFAPEKERLRLADQALRSEVSRLVLEAKAYEERAVEHLEEALVKLVKH